MFAGSLPAKSQNHKNAASKTLKSVLYRLGDALDAASGRLPSRIIMTSIASSVQTLVLESKFNQADIFQ